MWYGGGSKNWYPNEGLTVREFLTRLMYTSERPNNIPELRWKAMQEWYRRRLAEGVDFDDE